MTEKNPMTDLWDAFLQETNALCADMPARVRAARPLVHLLTNYVTVNDCVNAVLAVGGTAICAHAMQEAVEVCAGADALVCNLGCTEYYDAMVRAAGEANRRGIPIVVDPVGCAASSYRRTICLHLLRNHRPAAIRGNYAEISAVLNGCAAGRGLDSAQTWDEKEVEALKGQMRRLAAEQDMIVIASGKTDLCTDGKDFSEITRGTAQLRRITGAGCLSTAVLAAFLGTEWSMTAAEAALNFTALAGEAAQEACRQTGTGAGHFHMFLMDALSAADPVGGRERASE